MPLKLLFVHRQTTGRKYDLIGFTRNNGTPKGTGVNKKNLKVSRAVQEYQMTVQELV